MNNIVEDTPVYNKIYFVDRYDLACAKNELEIKMNDIDDKVEIIEDTLSDHIVEFTVLKKDLCEDIVRLGFDINKLDRNINGINKHLHLNIMCLDDDIKKLKSEYKLKSEHKQKERLYIMIIGFIFCLYTLLTHLKLIYFL